MKNKETINNRHICQTIAHTFVMLKMELITLEITQFIGYLVFI